jgi:hypothetical protein
MRRFVVPAVVLYMVFGSYATALADGTIDDAHNWHFGPHFFAVFKDGNAVAGTENYMSVRALAGSPTAFVPLAYIQWASGSCVRQDIFARIWDNTTGQTVKSDSVRASTCNRSTFFAPDQWMLKSLPAHSFHLHYVFSVWTSATGWITAAGQNSSPWSCTNSACSFT